MQWDPEEGRHVTHSIAPRDDPYPSSREPQKMNAVLGYALIDVMIKSDPEAQRLLTMVESPLERVWLSVWYPMRDRDVVVEPQKQVGPYRVDFLIEDQLVVDSTVIFTIAQAGTSSLRTISAIAISLLVDIR